MEPSLPLISAANLAKSYGSKPVLNDVSFQVFPGVTGLLGSNGAGKTTALGMILGLHNRDRGSLEVFGADPWTAGVMAREKIGYAPEHHTLSPTMAASEFVQLVCELHGLPKNEALTAANDALSIVGLGEERFRPMGSLSTGQRQRVKLAQALGHNPELVILDEPTDGLDPGQRETVLELIKSLSHTHKISVLLSSHLIEEVDEVCDSVIIIGDGRTLASGSIEHLKNRVEQSIHLELVPSDLGYSHFAEALTAKPAIKDVAIDGNSLTIGVHSDQAFDDVRDVCAETNSGIVSFGRRSLSLEDVFMESMS